MSVHRVTSDLHCGQPMANTQVLTDAYRFEKKPHVITARRSLPFFLVLLFGISLVLFVNQAWSADIGPIPIQVFLVWTIAVGLFLFRGRALREAISIFSLGQIAALSVLLGFVVLRGILNDWNMLRTAQMLTGIALALEGAIFFKDARGRKILFVSLAIGAVTSSAVAVLQYFDLEPELWQRSVYNDAGRFVYGATGLEATPVPYAYSVVGIGVVLMARFMLARNRLPRWLPIPFTLAFLFSALVLAGLLSSNSRSGILGFLSGVIIVEMGRRFLKFKSMIQPPVLIVLGGALLGYAVTIREVPVLEDLRLIANWVVYVPALIEFPLGRQDILAFDDLLYQAHPVAGASEIVDSFMSRSIIAPHNLFLTTGMEYGLIAMLAFIFLYVSLFVSGLKGFRQFAKKGEIISAVWVLVFIAANIAVFVHSWFHNASLAVGEMRNWLWVGLLLSQARVALEQARRKPSFSSQISQLRNKRCKTWGVRA